LVQLTATLLAAIAPEPALADLWRKRPLLTRHLHEPPRKKRRYQQMFQLF